MPPLSQEHTVRRSGLLHPIFIPSKGRPESSTAALLDEAEIPYNVLVEPQDRDAYYARSLSHGVLIQLPENDRGVTFVRNFTKDLAKTKDSAWFWILDDDIKNFYLVEKGRLVKSDPRTVLFAAQALFRRVGNVGIGALEYGQFAWSAKKDHAIGYCDVAVCLNAERTRNLRYRDNTKEDRDFALQVLKSGSLAVRATHCAFQAPKIGSNKGGLHEDYADGRDAEWAAQMAKDWPGLVTVVRKPDGRKDAKIKWAAFRPAK